MLEFSFHLSVNFLHEKLEKAIPTRDKQKRTFEQFTDVFKPQLINQWTKMIVDWDAAVANWERLGHVTSALPTITDPYREPIEGMSRDFYICLKLIVLESYFVYRCSRGFGSGGGRGGCSWSSSRLPIHDSRAILHYWVRARGTTVSNPVL
jgi:hypothetical protein